MELGRSGVGLARCIDALVMDSMKVDPTGNGADASISQPDDDRTPWRSGPLYGPFYGLTEAPFDLTPNPRFVFLTARQREVLSNLRYALATSKGFPATRPGIRTPRSRAYSATGAPSAVAANAPA